MCTDPDGFIGGAMAVRGIRDAATVLHGQKGCRKGLLSCDTFIPRPLGGRDPRFYGQYGEVPFSGITAYDYNGDSSAKLVKVLSHVSREDYSLRVVLGSPGVTLAGDDIQGTVDRLGMSDDTLTFGCEDLGPDCADGFDRMIEALMRILSGNERDVKKGTVVLIGLSTMHRDWIVVKQETSRLLGRAGLRVTAAIGADCSVDDIRHAADSEVALVISPEHCRRTASFLESQGVRIVSTGESPVGFDAVASMYRRVSDVTGRNADYAFQMLNMYRRRAFDAIVKSGKDMTGTTYHIDSEGSISVPLGRWLESSFGMTRVDKHPDFLFACGRKAVACEASGTCGTGIDIGFPSDSSAGFLKTPVLGLDGTMYILERLFSGTADRTAHPSSSSPGCCRDGCSYP